MHLDPIVLRTFVAVCETDSFTRAAARVNLTQSAVSLHVKRLEEQVGRRLFDRSAHKVALTEDGEVLLSYARRILALHNEAAARLGHPPLEGTVRLGAPEYFEAPLLATLLTQFCRRHPAVSLEIEMGIGPDIAAAFDQGRLDVAIVNRELGEGPGTVLWRDGRVWAAADTMVPDPDRPLPLAVFPPHCAWRRLAQEQLDGVGRPWSIALQCAGTAGIVAAVSAGLAVSVFARRTLPAGLRIVPAATGLPLLPDFEFVVLEHRDPAPAARRLAEAVIECFRLPEMLGAERPLNSP